MQLDGPTQVALFGIQLFEAGQSAGIERYNLYAAELSQFFDELGGIESALKEIPMGYSGERVVMFACCL